MAKPIIVDIPHDLGRIEARNRLERGMGQLREQTKATTAGKGPATRWLITEHGRGARARDAEPVGV